MVIDTILTLTTPFPGDVQYDSSDLRPELRFYVTHNTATRDYVIKDQLTDGRILLPQNLLENHEFDVSYWYARHRA